HQHRYPRWQTLVIRGRRRRRITNSHRECKQTRALASAGLVLGDKPEPMALPLARRQALRPGPAGQSRPEIDEGESEGEPDPASTSAAARRRERSFVA